MAATLDQIAGFFGNRNITFRRDDARGWLLVPFQYEPLSPLIVAVALEEDGRFLKIFAPRLMQYGDGPHKLALMQTLLHTSWESKMLQWEYDPIDGEVRAMVEFPIEDAELTEAQFFRAFDGLSRLAMLFYPRLKSVIETGSDPGRAEAVPESTLPPGSPPDAL
ncbi:MAG TPA: hypothetical protein VM658_18220 [bacterium]|nr:hypothetical protein [bacterium]